MIADPNAVPIYGTTAEILAAVPNDFGVGTLMISTTETRVWVVRFDAGLVANFLEELSGPTEILELLPIPEGRVAGNSTRVAQTTFEGCSYILRRRVTFNRILMRVTARAGAPTGRFLIYQGATGGAGIASLIATVAAFVIPAGGTNFEVTPAEGTVTAEAGLIYMLWGRDSAADSFTMRTYVVQALDLLTANVDAAYHPTTFQTVIAANTTPATFNPTEGGDANATSTDVPTVIRLRMV